MEMIRLETRQSLPNQEQPSLPLVNKTKDIALSILAYGGSAVVFAGGIALVASQHVIGALLGSLMSFCAMAYLAYRLFVKNREELVTKVIHKHQMMIENQAIALEAQRHLISVQSTAIRGLHNEIAEVKALHKDMGETAFKLEEISSAMSKVSDELQASLNMVKSFFESSKRIIRELKGEKKRHARVNVISEESIETQTTVEEFLEPHSAAVPQPDVTLRAQKDAKKKLGLLDKMSMGIAELREASPL